MVAEKVTLSVPLGQSDQSDLLGHHIILESACCGVTVSMVVHVNMQAN